MLTMFLGLSGIIHIICSLLSTSWGVCFFWYRVVVNFCWFFYLFPRNTWNNFEFAIFCFEFAIFLNTKISREKSGHFHSLQFLLCFLICCVRICLWLLYTVHLDIHFHFVIYSYHCIVVIMFHYTPHPGHCADRTGPPRRQVHSTSVWQLQKR